MARYSCIGRMSIALSNRAIVLGGRRLLLLDKRSWCAFSALDGRVIITALPTYQL